MLGGILAVVLLGCGRQEDLGDAQATSTKSEESPEARGAAQSGANGPSAAPDPQGTREVPLSPADVHTAAKDGRLAELEQLLAANPELVHVRDDEGRTPLHWAASGGHKEVAELVLSKGADPYVKDDAGQTPLSLAVKGGHKGVEGLLRERVQPRQSPMSDYHWQGIFGSPAVALRGSISLGDSMWSTSMRDLFPVHCLFQQGFFLAPQSADIDTVISDWIKRHPRASVRTITELTPSADPGTDLPDITFGDLIAKVLRDVLQDFELDDDVIEAVVESFTKMAIEGVPEDLDKLAGFDAPRLREAFERAFGDLGKLDREKWLADFRAQARERMGAEVQQILRRPKWAYVWIVDGEAILNVHLVRQGCCPAGVMLVGRWVTGVLGAGGKFERWATDEELDDFAKRVLAAEAMAQEEQLGIWASKVSQEDD